MKRRDGKAVSPFYLLGKMLDYRTFRDCKESDMPIKPLFCLFFLFATASARAETIPLSDADHLIAACEQKAGLDNYRLHICLLGAFNRLEKRTDQLTDRLLNKVGSHHALGRLKIIQWSNAITKSQSRWQKLVPWDCEWEGHILPDLKGAAVAIDRCGIQRAAKRVRLLEKRLQSLDNILKQKQ